MYSKGISWIDDCRIPFVDENTSRKQTPVKVEVYGWANHKGQIGSFDDTWKQGRFPANILVSDDMLNDGNKHGNLFNISRNKDVDGGTGHSLIRKHKKGESNGICDNGISSSRFYNIDKWFEQILND